MGRVPTKARPYLVKYNIPGGQSVRTYDTREEVLEIYAEVNRKGTRVQIYKLSMPTDMEVLMYKL